MSNSPSPSRDPNSNSPTTSESPGLHHKPTLSGTFTDYQIISTASRGWKYNIMKFAVPEDEEIEPKEWRQPIKLNRKDYQPPEPSAGGNSAVSSSKGGGSGVGGEKEHPKMAPMLGDDGRPVIGFDGRIVMVGSDGKVVPPSGSSKSSTNDGSKSKNKSKRRMKEVFLVPEETRKLLIEETYPWVIEEAPKEVKTRVSNGGSNTSTSPASTVIPGEVWSGHLLDPETSRTHGIFALSGSTFQFIRSNRFYKFTKPRMDVPDAAKAKVKKSKDIAQLWRGRKKGAALSEPTLRTLLGGGDGEDGGEDDEVSGDDEEEEERTLRKRKNKRLGQEGDIDEMEYEEEFADDDDKVQMDGEDEEAKETEERLKREYRIANRAHDATVDDDEAEFMENINELTGAGRALRRLVRRNGEGETYESDEENPYASDEEEEFDFVPLDGPAVVDQQQEEYIPANTSVLPSGSTPDTSQPQLPPTTALPGTLTSTGEESPVLPSTRDAAMSLKRKASDGSLVSPGADADSSVVVDGPRKKPRRSPLTEDMIIDFLRKIKVATPTDILQEFQSYLSDQENKKAFGSMIKKVALARNNTLVLREKYRDTQTSNNI